MKKRTWWLSSTDDAFQALVTLTMAKAEALLALRGRARELYGAGVDFLSANKCLAEYYYDDLCPEFPDSVFGDRVVPPPGLEARVTPSDTDTHYIQLWPEGVYFEAGLSHSDKRIGTEMLPWREIEKFVRVKSRVWIVMWREHLYMPPCAIPCTSREAAYSQFYALVEDALTDELRAEPFMGEVRLAAREGNHAKAVKLWHAAMPETEARVYPARLRHPRRRPPCL